MRSLYFHCSDRRDARVCIRNKIIAKEKNQTFVKRKLSTIIISIRQWKERVIRRTDYASYHTLIQ